MLLLKEAWVTVCIQQGIAGRHAFHPVSEHNDVMLPRDSANAPWSDVNDAYGPAAEIPVLLNRAEQAPDDVAVWDELWGRLCHQGTIYPASVQAVPYLAELAERPSGARALYLAADIFASKDPLELADRVRTTYPDAVSRLEKAAIRALPDGDIHALWALAACRNARPWQWLLADDEWEFECLQCLHSWALLIEEIDADDAAAMAGHDPDAFALARTCEVAGNDVLAHLMHRLAGAVRCPSCGACTLIADAMQA